jgi:putative flavoprotein involved in K+ transport
LTIQLYDVFHLVRNDPPQFLDSASKIQNEGVLMNEKFDTIVVGGGQAGLAIGYYLAQQKRKYVILEQASTIVSAWRSRWDSFTLVLPNWTLQMPDFAYHGNDPDGFLSRDEMVDYMEQFAATFDCHIRLNSKVNAIEKNPTGDRFLVHSSDHIYECANVVITTGSFQKHKIPAFSNKISPDVTQIHTSEYRNSEGLPDGAVLVVGSGQSGCQIAEELYHKGRKVYLCVGGAMRIPRFYRGKDSIWWLMKIKFFDQIVDTLPSPRAKFIANPFLTGSDGGHSLDLHQFARDGVTLLGRFRDVNDKTIFLLPDLKGNLTKIDNFVVELKKKIDDYIEDNHIIAEEDDNQDVLTDGYDTEMIAELDLDAEGINTIIWATGYRFDYSWIKFPVLDEDGYPIQHRGVSAVPGLYFLGLHWLYNRRSGLPWGVGEDAAYIAHEIANQSSPVRNLTSISTTLIEPGDRL